MYVALSAPQDTLERAYKQDVSGHTAEASKLYRLGIDTIYEGLGLQVPSAWLTGSNVNKWRSNLNSWLQLANDRYHSSPHKLHMAYLKRSALPFPGYGI